MSRCSIILFWRRGGDGERGVVYVFVVVSVGSLTHKMQKNKSEDYATSGRRGGGGRWEDPIGLSSPSYSTVFLRRSSTVEYCHQLLFVTYNSLPSATRSGRTGRPTGEDDVDTIDSIVDETSPVFLFNDSYFQASYDSPPTSFLYLWLFSRCYTETHSIGRPHFQKFP